MSGRRPALPCQGPKLLPHTRNRSRTVLTPEDIPGLTRCSDGLFRLEWKGTGAYPAQALGRPDPFSFGCRIIEGHRSLGLVAFDDAGVVRVTAVGERLVRIIGPAMDDPDLLLRWCDTASGLWLPEHGKAVDNWLRHAFRKAKAGVSAVNRLASDRRRTG